VEDPLKDPQEEIPPHQIGADGDLPADQKEVSEEIGDKDSEVLVDKAVEEDIWEEVEAPLKTQEEEEEETPIQKVGTTVTMVMMKTQPLNCTQNPLSSWV
jgi:hypothetical protein